jgi:hypothetical protein
VPALAPSRMFSWLRTEPFVSRCRICCCWWPSPCDQVRRHWSISRCTFEFWLWKSGWNLRWEGWLRWFVEGGRNVQALKDFFYRLVNVYRVVVPSFGDEVDGVGLNFEFNNTLTK